MWLGHIGESFGASSRFFRPEDNVSALSPPAETIRILDLDSQNGIDSNKMPLRLYCIVLSPQIVILVNGGIKESQELRDSSGCFKQQQFASNISSQIHRMIKQGELEIKGKQLKRTKSFKLFLQEITYGI